jgi:hypothetical protein
LVIFQFSGHGSRIEDKSGNQADGMDSTLVPVNSRDPAGKNFDIVGDEIRDLFDELSRYTSNIVFILDCCFSSNPTRDGQQARGIDMDTRPQPTRVTRTQPGRTGAAGGDRGRTRSEDSVGMLPRDQRYVSIAAARSYEWAFEIRLGADHWEGALTHFLVRELKRTKADTTYGELRDRVANEVTAQFAAQHPQVEGDLRRPVLAGSANREDAFIRISKVAGNRITIEAGAAQGLTEGTILGIYAPDARRLTGPDERLATARLTGVEYLASTAELLQPGRITTDAKAVVLSRDFGSVRTRVLLEPRASVGDRAAAVSKTISQIKELLSGNKAIEVVRESKNASEDRHAEVVLMRGRFGEVFKDKASLAPSSISGPPANEGPRVANGKLHPLAEDEEVFYLTGPDRARPLFGFAARVGERESGQRIADAIEHLANQRALRAVYNAASELNNQIVLTVIKVFGARDENGFLKEITGTEMLELGGMDQDYHFDQGEMFKFRIENHSPRDLYVILFDISTDGAIQILYPPLGSEGVRIKSGEKKFEIATVFATTGPPGYETLKIIATTVQKSNDDFAFLEQGAVRGTRAIPVKVEELADWTTTQIDFVISSKRSQR